MRLCDGRLESDIMSSDNRYSGGFFLNYTCFRCEQSVDDSAGTLSSSVGRLKKSGRSHGTWAEDEAYERLDYELEAAGSRGMIVALSGSIAMILLLKWIFHKYIESLNGSGIMWFLLEILTHLLHWKCIWNVWQIRYVRVMKIYPAKKESDFFKIPGAVAGKLR